MQKCRSVYGCCCAELEVFFNDTPITVEENFNTTLDTVEDATAFATGLLTILTYHVLLPSNASGTPVPWRSTNFTDMMSIPTLYSLLSSVLNNASASSELSDELSDDEDALFVLSLLGLSIPETAPGTDLNLTARLLGSSANLTFVDPDVTVATVVTPDIPLKEGLVHIIDAVLAPPGVVELLQEVVAENRADMAASAGNSTAPGNSSMAGASPRPEAGSPRKLKL